MMKMPKQIADSSHSEEVKRFRRLLQTVEEKSSEELARVGKPNGKRLRVRTDPPPPPAEGGVASGAQES